MRCSCRTGVLCVEPGQIHPVHWETAESCQAPWTGQKNSGARGQRTPPRSSEATKVHPAAGKGARPLHQWDQQLIAEGKQPRFSAHWTDRRASSHAWFLIFPQVQQKVSEVEVREKELFDWRKKVSEVECTLAQQENLLECAVKERNLYSRNLMEAQVQLPQGFHSLVHSCSCHAVMWKIQKTRMCFSLPPGSISWLIWWWMHVVFFFPSSILPSNRPRLSGGNCRN